MKQFHGFFGLAGGRTVDAYFVELLEDAGRRGATLWFVDSLPNYNFCLSDAPEPRSIDCREKYPGFYERCVSPEPGAEAVCRHLPLY